MPSFQRIKACLTFDTETIDIANEDPDDSNELRDVGRGLEESDDINIIDLTVTSNVGKIDIHH